jgi:hypothetical protein
MEGSGLRLETQNGLHGEAAGVSEVDVFGISEHSVGELEVAAVDFLQTLASLNWKSLHPISSAEVVCFVTCTG